METTKPYYRKKKYLFLKNIGVIKIYFSSVYYTNAELSSCWTRKNTEKFFMENSTPNIKNNTLYNDYKDCGLWVKKRRYLKK